MNRIILIFFCTLSLQVFAQSDQEVITGTWVGYYSYLGKNYPYKLDIKLNGDNAEAIVMTKESPEEYNYRAEGNFKDGVLKLKGKKVLVKNSSGCLATITLNLVKADNDTYLLEGKWGPQLGGCLVSGKANLTRTIERNEQIEVTKSSDAITEEFLKGMEKRTYHGLFITIDDYEDDIGDLDNPIGDGQSVKQVLVSEYGFREENIEFLENPTRQQIIDKLDQLSSELNDYDNLLIYYAGHGIWDEDLNQGYWLPSDATLVSKGQWLSNSTIRDYLRSIKTKHTLLVADACFSGGILKERAVAMSGKAIITVYNLPSRKAITSGTLTTVPDKSVFSYYLIKKLNENTDKVLPADLLFSRMKVAVINNSPNNQVPQYGAIHQAGDEGGDFMFIRKDN